MIRCKRLSRYKSKTEDGLPCVTSLYFTEQGTYIIDRIMFTNEDYLANRAVRKYKGKYVQFDTIHFYPKTLFEGILIPLYAFTESKNQNKETE